MYDTTRALDVAFPVGTASLGLALADNAGAPPVLVDAVPAGGAGAALGVVPGSMIVAVNGRPVGSVTGQEMLELLSGAVRPLVLRLVPPPPLSDGAPSEGTPSEPRTRRRQDDGEPIGQVG